MRAFLFGFSVHISENFFARRVTRRHLLRNGWFLETATPCLGPEDGALPG